VPAIEVLNEILQQLKEEREKYGELIKPKEAAKENFFQAHYSADSAWRLQYPSLISGR